MTLIFTGREQRRDFAHPCSRPVDMAREHGPWIRVVCSEL